MHVYLYQNKSKTITVKKSLSSKTDFEGHFRDDSSIVDPVVLIEAESLPASKFNYMYIPQFSRYYFIYTIDNIRTGLWSVVGHTDVLMSFSKDILSSSQFIERNEVRGKRNTRLPDNNIPLTTRRKFDCIAFGDRFLESEYFVLTTMSAPARVEGSD